MFTLICAVAMVLAVSPGAQDIPGTGIPPAPASGFSDEGGLLDTEVGAEQRITAMIRDLRERHGYLLYLVIKPTLISTNPSDLAALLQQEWLPEGGGLVLVYESDTGQMGFGRSLEFGDGINENEAGVPSYELIALVSKALEAVGGAEGSAAYLEAVTAGVAEGLQEYFERKQAPVDGSRSLKLTLVTVGFLSFLALCGMGLGWLLGKTDKRQAERRAFPPVDAPERLSAPYGGGGGGYGSFGNGNP